MRIWSTTLKLTSQFWPFWKNQRCLEFVSTYVRRLKVAFTRLKVFGRLGLNSKHLRRHFGRLFTFWLFALLFSMIFWRTFTKWRRQSNKQKTAQLGGGETRIRLSFNKEIAAIYLSVNSPIGWRWFKNSWPSRAIFANPILIFCVRDLLYSLTLSHVPNLLN